LQNTIDQNNRFVVLGKKMAGFVDRFTIKSRKKGANTEVLNDLTKFLKIEKTKLEEIKLQKQVVKAVKKKAAKAKPEVDQHQRHKIKEGSQVKLISTKKSGTVESVAGDQITVLFGFMKMKVDRSKLTWIQ
jgi:glycerol kinase